MFIREECFLLQDPESERRAVLERLSQAVSLLGSPLDPRLIPSGGLSIGFAIRGARDNGGIAGLRNGISPGPSNPSTDGNVTFGADAQITRIILTTMKFEPVIFAAVPKHMISRASASSMWFFGLNSKFGFLPQDLTILLFSGPPTGIDLSGIFGII